ncbi:hypothetical protein O0544_16500 [Edwardsiella anguillarum]|nr:hypothetical protein [Edwardsiella anguillarum]
MKVLSKDQKLTIQVGANDGETIDIDLKNINAQSLGLDKFNVADSVDTTKVAAAAPAKVKTNVDVAITNDPALKAGGKDIASYEQKGDDLYAKNADGKLFKVTTIDTTTGKATAIDATEYTAGGTTAVTSIKKEVAPTGPEAANVRAYTGTEKGASAYVIQEGTGADAKYFKASVAEDGTVTKGSALSTTAKTADPLATLDKALSQVDDLRSGRVRYRTVSIP